jgi:hypothetical protein
MQGRTTLPRYIQSECPFDPRNLTNESLRPILSISYLFNQDWVRRYYSKHRRGLLNCMSHEDRSTRADWHCSTSAANDFWTKTYKELFNKKEATQNIAILTGCSAGATESIVVRDPSPLPTSEIITAFFLGGSF